MAAEMRRCLQTLNKGKDFDNNVEAYESTCNTRPAG
jgi:hypothetical protein